MIKVDRIMDNVVIKLDDKVVHRMTPEEAYKISNEFFYHADKILEAQEGEEGDDSG